MIITKNGLTKEIPQGYSWTTLFFGVCVPLFRGDMKGFIIQSILATFTGGMAFIIISFKYNAIYLERMINKGWMIKE